MELTLLIKSVLGLVVILGILVFLLVMSSKSKKASSVEVVEKAAAQARPATDLPTLTAIVKNKKSSAKELKEALDLIMKYHGTIHPKLGSRTHPEYDIYMEILFMICRHPNTNKDIILSFNRELEQKNPDYKVEINEAITKGLNSRGA
ncbi:MAG: hypothetical protein FP820_06715 [Sulfurimonas sp.]|nr:hypothetical protein [Sulfurimonas sp.]MBU3938461.1 hypothetical protein [bacterium]MBU4025458.1 hypothetical protein [bacterium]MBU4059206.1 hypothetical protein [bacterium]MBU4111411.1 hypothetical protein [bacterium]